MADIERFLAYAAAFEKAYASDDFSVVEPFFHADAVYEVPLPAPLGGRFEGRAAILAYFKSVLDAFDRRFATRRVQLLEGPTEKDGVVWLRGRATYEAEGVPDLTFELEEEARFEGDRIVHLADRYAEAERALMARWLDRHGATLGIHAPARRS